MTLPPLPDQPLFRISKQIAKDVFTLYAGSNISISLWSQELEMKLIYGTEKAFDEQEAVRRICTDYGVTIESNVTQVLRGTKLTIEVILRE